jgi:hypothetical protein
MERVAVTAWRVRGFFLWMVLVMTAYLGSTSVRAYQPGCCGAAQAGGCVLNYPYQGCSYASDCDWESGWGYCCVAGGFCS